MAVALIPLVAGTAGGQVLDRSKRPVAPPPPAFDFPDVRSHTLPNGLVVRVVENHALPLVAVRAFIEGGSILDPVGKEGLFSLDTLLLRDGTTSMSGEQLTAAIDDMGAPVAATRFTTISSSFERSLALMADMLMHPSFPAEAVARRKDAATQTLQRVEGTASTVGLRIFNVTLWGASHPYARTASPASIASITRDDIVRFHDANVRPQNVTITIVGDVTDAAAVAAATKLFGQWQRTGERVAVNVPAAPTPKPTTIYLFDRPGSTQSTVFIGQTAPSRSTSDFYALETMGGLFGGPTGSRLTMSLRERRPLTYAVSHYPVWRRAGDPSSIHGS
ncbi:MAG TPA: pitrilysin family protein, partial [Gemmatimonadaceae bacterium]